MMSKQLVTLSKFLSLILRHQPERIGLQLDANGWADIQELLRLVQTADVKMDEQTLYEVVATSDKKRFAISADGRFIRANQGHSLAIELALEAQTPVDILFHGTAARFLQAIMSVGLTKMNRHHVHLTENAETAGSVGKRYGQPVLLQIDALAMHQSGRVFFRTENDVWLVDAVPPEFITVV